ncbi:hypothetical protein METH109765_21135 [Mesobacillus thioparans]
MAARFPREQNEQNSQKVFYESKIENGYILIILN